MFNGAIIGFGKIARTNHLLAYKDNSLRDLCKITSIVEPNLQNLKKSRGEYPEINFYESLDKLFENEKIDFVDITAPPANHYEILEKCIERNVHIICEKPFTLSSLQAENLREKLHAYEKVFIPCHQYKYSPIWKEFKKFVDGVDSRSKVLVQFNVFRTEADPGLKQISGKWRTSLKETGGGILADTGVHYLYLSSWLLGRIDELSARLLNLGHDVFESEDTAVIQLGGPKGEVQITLTWAADKRYNSANIVCSNASMYYGGGTNMTINANNNSLEVTVPDMSDKANYTAMYVSLFSDFFDAVKKQCKRSEWINDAFVSVNLLNSCYSSSTENRVIRVNDER